MKALTFMKDGRDFLYVFDNVTPTGFGLPLGIMFYKISPLAGFHCSEDRALCH